MELVPPGLTPGSARLASGSAYRPMKPRCVTNHESRLPYFTGSDRVNGSGALCLTALRGAYRRVTQSRIWERVGGETASRWSTDESVDPNIVTRNLLEAQIRTSTSAHAKARRRMVCQVVHPPPVIGKTCQRALAPGRRSALSESKSCWSVAGDDYRSGYSARRDRRSA